MRKIFTVMFLAMMILIGGQSAHAQDVYVGTSNTTGRDCYVMTETIHWQNYYECDATLKMVRPSNGNVQYLYYNFRMMHHWAEFTNSQGYSGRCLAECPIEMAMWHAILDYSQSHNIRH